MVSFCGCFDYKDIDRRIFITEVGIDSGERTNEIKLIVKAASPKEKTEINARSYVIYKTSADSIGLAFRRIKAQAALETDFSHMKVITIGKEFALNYNINNILNYFVRRRDMQNSAYLLIALPSAESIVSHKAEGENVPGSDIFLRFGQGVKSQYAVKTRIADFYRQVKTPGISPSCPVIDFNNENVLLDKVAIFDEQGRIKLYLSKEDVRWYNIFIKKLNYGYISGTDYKLNNGKIGINILSSKVKYKFNTTNNSIYCNINVKLKTNLEESYETIADNKKLTKEFEEISSKAIEKLLKIFQDSKVDPLELQVNYWANNIDYDISKDWKDKIFPNIIFKVKVNIEIGGSGSLKQE